MEIEVKHTDPTGTIHTTVVKSNVEFFSPRWINNAVFRSGKDIIFTRSCPYSGTELKAHSFRMRVSKSHYEKSGDFFYRKIEKPSAWSKWFNYQEFYDECFPEIEVVRTIVKVRQSTRHA